MTQAKLPSPETYERELAFMPYERSLRMVKNIVSADAPKHGRVLDLMCGPGYLVRKIASDRRDLITLGVDIDRAYIDYARDHEGYRFTFRKGDIFTWQPNPARQFDVVLCTGALHHIPYEKQEQAVERIAQLTKPEGFAIISDCYIDDYENERERQLAAAKLGYEYLWPTIENGAPKEVIEATIDILRNDVAGLEFKTSVGKRLPVLQRYFRDVKTMKTWPNRQLGGYGDYVHVLRK